MGVKPGYKQTEVGVIPEDWDVEPLGSVCDIVAGRDLVKADYSRTESQAYPFPIYSNALTKKGLYGYSRSYQYEADRITVTARGDIGHAVHRNTVFSAIGRLLVLSSKRDCDLQFLTGFINHAVDFALESTGVPQLTGPQIAKYAVALPPTREEQEAIAEALSHADALVESLEQLLAKKHQIKQGATQELLTGERRLPGFKGNWGATTLGQMGRCHRGVSYNPNTDLSPFDSNSTVRLLRSNNVQEARVVFVDMQYVDSRRVSAEQRLRTHDILICMANGSRDLVGKAGHFTRDDGLDYTFGAFMGCFRPNSQAADPNFAFYLFQTEKYRAHIANLLAGSSINNLTPGNVEALVISVPTDRAEQTAIATILSDMDAEIAALEAKLAKARQLKQGMMQELLTGRIRLV